VRYMPAGGTSNTPIGSIVKRSDTATRASTCKGSTRVASRRTPTRSTVNPTNRSSHRSAMEALGFNTHVAVPEGPVSIMVAPGEYGPENETRCAAPRSKRGRLYPSRTRSPSTVHSRLQCRRSKPHCAEEPRTPKLSLKASSSRRQVRGQ
jgi:hypothetical protein